jgi:23S rRNA (guanosine2251-2'-O)-methyltransferase
VALVLYAESMTPISVGDRNPIFIVAENVRSLFNVGALFRSADGINAAGVYLTGFTGYPPRKEIRRVALGAEDTVPWIYEQDTTVVLETLKGEGIQTVALEKTPNSVDYRLFAYTFPVAIVVGHEVDGVQMETLESCDAVVSIPMLGQKASLNVSVSGGIILYELLRVIQRS